MKRYFKSLLIFSLVSVGGLLHAQATNTENYIQTRTYLEGVTTSSTTARQIQSVQYFDGLGRPKQVVNVKASPLGRDVITHIEYDGFGRQVNDYLPVPQSSTLNGAIVPNPLTNATQTNIYGTEKIYAEKTLENSPLDRILEQKQVGTAWSTKPVKFQYDANIQADYVRKYETTTTWDPAGKMTVSTIQLLQYFLPNSLYKNTITDEDGNKTIEFKNGQGQVVLVRKILSATENADTYYVYNEYNQLAFVVPPASPATLDDTALNNFCYQYRYDGRNRLVEKKIPGKGWEYMVYDKQDRLIMTQDANMKVSGNWLFTKYDKFSRVVYTGTADIGAQFNRGQVQFSADYYIDQGQPSNEERNTTGFTNSGMTVYYGNAVYPTTVAKVLSINYYDTYPTGTPTIPTQVLSQNVLPQNAQSSNVSTKSLPVASYVKNIEDDNWTKAYTWYDMRGRVIGSYSINHLGGYTKTETELDFAGVPQKVNTYHKRLTADTEKIIKEVFTYDNQNRLLTHTHQINSGSVEYLAQNKYNELSQLENKKVGGTSAAVPLQTVDYKYNIRGWMTKINDPANLSGKLFGYEIKYSNPVFSGTAPGKFNGNIAEIDWKSSMDGILRRYDYQYDTLNRLGKGTYSEPGSSLIYNNYFNEELTYDLNGNILTLKRLSKPSSGTVAESIDDLVYNYYNGQSNRLQKITLPSGVTNNPSGYNALGNTIGYDDNGNMTDQLDKGITKIIYNYLNLPNSIKKSTETINYTYRADGVKVGKNSSGIATQTDYLDGFQYETTTGVALLKFIPTSEGYYNFENNKYIYNYTDHLGNVRLSYTRNDTGTEIIEENNYYPFGLKHERYNNLAGNSSYQYKYNGKELQTETGMYAMDFRHYMPDIGRFGVMDPLTGVIPGWTPYRFAFNNPVYFKDPTGLFEETGNALATCPTCPDTPEFKPYIDDPNNTYVYIPETNTAEKEIQIQEVAVTGKKSESGTLDYLNFFNDRIGDTGDLISHIPNQGGSIAFWTTPSSGRVFDGIPYSRVNVRYYRNNWGGNGYTGATTSVSKFLKRGSIVGQVVLGAVEVGQGVADDVNDYNTKGGTNGKNTAVASAKVATGAAVGWAAGAATGALIGSSFPVVGTIVGAVVGGVAGYYASEAAGELVEKAYE